MSDLVAFLRERLDEDEQVARAATQGRWFWADPGAASFPQGDRSLMADHGSWKVCHFYCQWSGEANLHRGEPGEPGRHEHREADTVISGWGYDASGLDVEEGDAAHILRHDPARVLAEVAAKRRIVEEHDTREVASLDRDDWGRVREVCRRCREGERQIVAPCPTLRLIALPYASHESYRPEWRP